MSTGTPAPGEIIELPPGAGVLVNRLGAAPVRVSWDGGRDQESAVLLDIGGKVNKLPTQEETRYLMAPGRAAELVAELMKTGQTADPTFMDQVREFLDLDPTLMDQARKLLEENA